MVGFDLKLVFILLFVLCLLGHCRAHALRRFVLGRSPSSNCVWSRNERWLVQSFNKKRQNVNLPLSGFLLKTIDSIGTIGVVIQLRYLRLEIQASLANSICLRNIASNFHRFLDKSCGCWFLCTLAYVLLLQIGELEALARDGKEDSELRRVAEEESKSLAQQVHREVECTTMNNFMSFRTLVDKFPFWWGLDNRLL